MNNKEQMRILELSFNIMEKILSSKKFESREEVMSVAKKSIELTKDDSKLPLELRMAYLEAYKKIESLSWTEMLEIIDIISED